MRSDSQYFNINTCLPVKDCIGKTSNTISPNIGWKLDFRAMSRYTHVVHCNLKSIKVTLTQALLLGFVIRHMF